MGFFFGFTKGRFRFGGTFCNILGLFHTLFELLSQTGKLVVVRIFLLDLLNQFIVLLLQLLNRNVALLKLLFNDLELLRVGEGVLALDNFLEIGSESGALIHVHLYLDFRLMSASVFDVSFEKFNFIVSLLQFEVLIPYLALQINDKVVRARLVTQCTSRSLALQLLLLLQEIINHFILAGQLVLGHLETRFKL